MKKIASLFLALALCMGLAVPAFAAELKSDQFTYNLSNEPVGTTEYTYEVYEMDENGNFLEDENGNISTVTVTDTIYLVPEGTVITNPDSSYCLSVAWIDLETGDGGGLENRMAFTVTGEGVYHVTSEEMIYLAGITGGVDKGIWVAVAPGSTPVQPAQPTAPVTPAEPAQPAAPATPAAPDAPGTYTVKKGDTWSTICTNFYGTNAQRYDLMKANKGVKLTEGAVITLPGKLGGAALIAAPVAGAGETLYTVKLGDTLGAIAKATYGDMMKYQAIFERNSDRLKNANTIYEGQVIVLPAK